MWQVPLLSRSASWTSSHPIPVCGCHLQLNIPCQVTPQEEHVFNQLDSPTYHTAATCFAPLSTKTHTGPPLCHCKLTPVRHSHTYSSRRQRDWRDRIDNKMYSSAAFFRLDLHTYTCIFWARKYPKWRKLGEIGIINWLSSNCLAFTPL